MKECSGVFHLFLLVGSVALLLGCATTPPVTVKAEVAGTQNVSSQTVSVMSDSYMDQVEEADRVAGLVREALVRQGFVVKGDELGAEIIIIPTLARSNRSDEPRSGRASLASRASRFKGSSQTGMMHNDIFVSRGFEMNSAAYRPETRIGLMVTAMPRKEWEKAVDEDPARLWRLTAITTTSQNPQDDPVARLVSSLEPELAKLRVNAAPNPR